MEFDKDLYAIQEARDAAAKAEEAAKILNDMSAEQIDAIVKSMAIAGEKNAKMLAEMAHEETKYGKVEDKIYKNHMATGMLYDAIKDMKTSGVIEEDKVNKTVTMAYPVGPILGITPTTNPTSTIMYKSIIAVKAKNPIVFSPHPRALKCSQKAAEIMADAAVAAGAPDNTVQCLSVASMEGSNTLMHDDRIKLIIATGGPGMVKAAYSAGKPAIGVGPGNSPTYIERTADVKEACEQIIASKTFDYSTVCATEQSIICEKCNEAEVIAELKRLGAYFMNEEEVDKVCHTIFKNGHTMTAEYVSQPATKIAHDAGFEVPDSTTVLIGRQAGVGPEYPLSYEKLTTVLAFYTVEDWEEACELSKKLLTHGIGHTMNIHTNDPEIALRFMEKPASRILVNTGGAQGGTGASTGLFPAFTLGCGTLGGSSVSENVSPMHLINKKTLCYGIKDLDTLVADDKIYQKYHGNETVGNKSVDISSEELKSVIDAVINALR
jgi:acetaldehyde dehydrogenase (acetylating)